MALDKRVLIVDDEEKVVFFLRESLEELGRDCTIGTARSAEEALQKIDANPYDLVISDLRMPGLDGLQLLERVKETHPNTRFILMTAFGSDEVEIQARNLKAYDYITKPFHVSDLLRVARLALAEMTVDVDSDAPLHDVQIEAVHRSLSNLRFEVSAQCVVLADMKGQVLSEVGSAQDLDTSTLVPLLANGLNTVSGMAQYLQDEETINLNVYEGKKYDIYSTRVSDRLFLTLVFDRRKQASRVGMVWLYVKRTIRELLRTLYGEVHEDADDPQESAEQAPPSEIAPESTKLPAATPQARSDKPQTDQTDNEGEIVDTSVGNDSTFGIEEALRKGLIDEEFARLLKEES
jgi:DNA-binding response OmpR family regulator